MVTLPVTEPAHPTELYHALVRLKEEHEALKQAIFQLEEQAKTVIRSCDAEMRVRTLRSLVQETFLLNTKLEEHSIWEEQILYPFLNDYFHKSAGPSIIPSFWVLEKDHELAKAYLDAFTDLAEALVSSDDDKIVGTAEHLTQACHILKGHLHMEEELVYPLTEQILTDMDYFFS
ncbi:hemerythrin domain-containing protein [Paenibacillus allorhizosphaerae]|uniref:Hemerythrin-like domain-containing protein n=1 Tax=Paenibacillus allorhizosphaerae TaxID=2849866 RepID=A0ABN7TDR1_9BACL|nr:hemerythrin domain-containing protein [Paenibacillus allorhizosphaerae]CAG7625862.1 hypothetical protein PAECIP111802_01191 [Paenibacillus allorhizosphaerae]